MEVNIPIIESVGLPSFRTKKAKLILSANIGAPISMMRAYIFTDSNMSSSAPSQWVMGSMRNMPARSKSVPDKTIISTEILKDLFAVALSPLPESMLIAIQPPTAKRAASALITIYMGVANVTTDNEASSR